MKTKKMISLLLAMITLLSITAGLSLSAYARADDDDLYYIGDDFEFRYTVLEDGTAEITDFNGEATDLVIPSEIDGYAVTSIRRFSFYFEFGNTNLTSITIPSSVTSIADRAFMFTSLLSITVDSENEYFSSQDGVLFNKDKTALIYYPECNERTSYVIPGETKIIKEYAFCENKSLTSVTIPDGLESIGAEAFSTCYSLRSMVLPESVTYIGSGAFSGSGYIESIYILNKDCEIVNSERIPYIYQTLCYADIYGYKGSTAQAYAEEHGNNFIALDALEDNIIADGTDEVYVIGSENGASIHCTYPLDEFISVAINGNIVDEANYTLAEDSTILTFTSEYLDTLESGKYEVTLNFATGSVSTSLTIENAVVDEPTTEEPVTEAPVDEEPTTEAPATETPKNEPTTAEPTTTKPATEPTTVEPKDKTTTVAPKDEPTTDAPAVEEPVTEAPKTESTTEEPTTKAPATEAAAKTETTKPSTTEKGDNEKSPSTGAANKGLFALAAIALATGTIVIIKKKEQD